MADVTVAQLRALYAVARWPDARSSDGDSYFLDDWMLMEAGRLWRTNLRRALAEVSRELARARFTKRRK